jgi:hypothetical protein
MQSASLLAPSRLDAIQPPRSRLFAIEPLALQTPAVESFTSYLMRLAEAHCVQLGTLIHVAVAPRLQNTFVAQGPSRNVTIFLRTAALLNSHGVSAADWGQALTALTLRTELPLLTMLPWAQGISLRQLVHPHRQWCPCYFEEWRIKGRLVYEPLVWAMAGVQVCPTHRCPMEQQCPACLQESRLSGLARASWFVPSWGLWPLASCDLIVTLAPLLRTSHHDRGGGHQCCVDGEQRVPVDFPACFVGRRIGHAGAPLAPEWNSGLLSLQALEVSGSLAVEAGGGVRIGKVHRLHP